MIKAYSVHGSGSPSDQNCIERSHRKHVLGDRKNASTPLCRGLRLKADFLDCCESWVCENCHVSGENCSVAIIQ